MLHEEVKYNTEKILKSIQQIFKNHNEHFWNGESQKRELPEVK